MKLRVLLGAFLQCVVKKNVKEMLYTDLVNSKQHL